MVPAFIMNDLLKQLQDVEQRIGYLIHIKDTENWGNLANFRDEAEQLKDSIFDLDAADFKVPLEKLDDAIRFLEERCEEGLTPMERVRIVRSPLRFSLKDILENVYEEYTELGGEGEANIDPAMMVAKANIVRRIKKKPYTSPVMIIGQEVGHGEEFRNGGSCKPWGNEKAMRYMQVAETEGIPILLHLHPGVLPCRRVSRCCPADCPQPVHHDQTAGPHDFGYLRRWFRWCRSCGVKRLPSHTLPWLLLGYFP